MSIALDGSAHGNSASASSLAVSLTTANANDLIFVAVTDNGDVVTGVTATGLTFSNLINGVAARADVSSSAKLSVWWALAATALTALSITVTTTNTQFLTVDAFGVSGADTVTPFDTNAASPTIDSTAPADPSAITTDAVNTMLVNVARMSGTANPTQGTGNTNISGANFQIVQYRIVTAPQTGFSLALGTGAGDSNGSISFAIRQASAAATDVIPLYQSIGLGGPQSYGLRI